MYRPHSCILLVKDGSQDVTDKSGVALRLKTDKNPSWHTSKPERTGPFQSEEFNGPAELLPEFLAKKHFELPNQVLDTTFKIGFIFSIHWIFYFVKHLFVEPHLKIKNVGTTNAST